MTKLSDITGKVFHSLTVVERTKNNKAGQARWVCKCKCGNTTIVTGLKLRHGSTKSCGCAKKDAQRRRLVDISGNKYNRLIVIKMDGYIGTDAACLCKCDCGNEVSIIAYDVKRGHTKSCGCLNNEGRRIANLQHGHTTTNTASRTYRSWRAMKQRCYDKTQPGYHNYGGRGITVCAEWFDSFESFLDDMGERPKDMTLDRIDNNGNYNLDNCRWATLDIQSSNRRKGFARKRKAA